MVHLASILCASLWILLLSHQLTAAPTTSASVSKSFTTTQPLGDQKAASSEENQETDKAIPAAAPPATNGNVYGADNGGGASANQANKPENRGYNQGYSYNTGIKPYRTGYTYFQPFGDAADQQNGQNHGAAPQTGTSGGVAKPAAVTGKQIPVELPNFFGIDPKQMGPMRVIPNQNVPVDENGIPNLDAIKIPANNGNGHAVGTPAKAIAPVAQAPQVQNLNPQDFSMGNDFNLNQILGSGQAQRAPPKQAAFNPANDNSMFDFAPPPSQNFDFAQNGGSNDGRDYNRLDNFAGNLNNFDTYLGDNSLPMLDNGGGGNGNGGGNGGGTGFADLGTGQQQMPSEIDNLNNAFGSNTNQNSNNDMLNILNQLNGANGGDSQPPQGSNEMDFGNFGNAATNRNQQQLFPFF